jgi:hypothetical protein
LGDARKSIGKVRSCQTREAHCLANSRNRARKRASRTMRQHAAAVWCDSGIPSFPWSPATVPQGASIRHSVLRY